MVFPDLSPDVHNVYIERPFVLDPESGAFVPGLLHLYFDTWAQNLGTVPMQLTVEDFDATATSTVAQCVAWTLRACRQQQTVDGAGFTWHDEHKHFHFDDFAAYELRHIGVDGRPDYSDTGLLAVSDKVSFCMVDSWPVNLEEPSPPFYKACTNAMQGISPGWADIYDATTPGQQLPVEGLADGRYALIVRMNHAGRLFETDYGNNVVEITVELSAGTTQAVIVGRNHP